MSFIDSYKHSEKLCGEILNDDRRLSTYIDEIFNMSYSYHYVRNIELNGFNPLIFAFIFMLLTYSFTAY